MTLELGNVNLMTPEADANGNAITYWQPDFPDNEFHHVNELGNAELWAPTAGASSANSSRARTEYREVVPDPVNFTRVQKNWLYSSGKHTMRAASIIRQLPQVEETICIGQIHTKDGTGPAAKLVVDRDKLKFSFRETFGATPVNHVLAEGIQIGDRINFSFISTVTGKIYCYLAINGVNYPTTIYELDSTWDDKLLYFKAGVYVLEDATATTQPTEGGRVEMDKLEFVHEE